MTEDEKWMSRCLTLAACGKVGAAPNPMVGAVIVYKGNVIGEGFHAHYGESHAEVNAFASVKRPDLLTQSKMYVNMEPCAHYGHTPPCAELIIKKGIKEVIVGMIDPFEKVNGEGIRMLLKAGITVRTGILENECLELNKKFIVYQTKGRPFITLKWAQSADGYIAPKGFRRSAIFVSTPHTLMRVHKIRGEHQALLVGRKTVEMDNPALTVRYWASPQPLRITTDRWGTLRGRLRFFDGKAPSLVIGEKDPEERQKLGTYNFMKVDYSKPSIFPQLLSELKKMEIQSLLVEGGREILQGFIDLGLWDEAQVEIGPVPFSDGLKAPLLPANSSLTTETYFGQIFNHIKNPNPAKI